VLRHIPGSQDPLSGGHPWLVLVEASDAAAESNLEALMEEALAAAIEAGDAADAAVAKSEAQAAALWALRENLSEAQKREGFSVKHDISIPVSRLAEFVDRAGGELKAAFPGVRIVCFGHLGDGNLHYNPSMPDAAANADFIARTPEVNRIVHNIANALGGSISAEHGLGQLKRTEIRRYKSAVELELMRAVKQALDPRGLMNPGKVV
jgi:FAD/FMN-containing dehydrogenase